MFGWAWLSWAEHRKLIESHKKEQSKKIAFWKHILVIFKNVKNSSSARKNVAEMSFLTLGWAQAIGLNELIKKSSKFHVYNLLAINSRKFLWIRIWKIADNLKRWACNIAPQASSLVFLFQKRVSPCSGLKQESDGIEHLFWIFIGFASWKRQQ